MRKLLRTLAATAVVTSLIGSVTTAPARAAADTLAAIRARGVLHCASVIRPGIAVPTLDGKQWYGIAPDMCRAVAAAVLGDSTRIVFRPYFDGKRLDGTRDALDDIVFVASAQLVGDAAPGAGPLQLGPVIAHDSLALLVPQSGPRHIAELSGKSICVEAGSAADRALTRYFGLHELTLQQHPFQETDEMRQAYADGACAGVAGPLTTLGSVRADPQDGHRSDRILPELLADDPIFASTAGDARWARIIWWTFSALVDAEDVGIDRDSAAQTVAIPGIPPAVGQELELSAHWAQDAVAAGGNYAELYDVDLGAHSHLNLARGENALWRNGGRIYGLRVE